MTKKTMEKKIARDEGTFVNNSSSKPLQKTLTGKYARNNNSRKIKFKLHNDCPSIKIFITRRSRRVTQSKFFERVWKNFCPQKFFQFSLSFATV